MALLSRRHECMPRPSYPNDQEHRENLPHQYCCMESRGGGAYEETDKHPRGRVGRLGPWLCRLAFVLLSDGILDFHGEPTQPCRRRTEQVRVLQAIIDFFGCDVVLYTGVCIIGRGNYFYGVRLPRAN